MNRQRFVTLLIGAVVVIALAIFWGSRRNSTAPSEGKAFLPTLAKELGTVTEVMVQKGSPTPTVTLRKLADHWVVAERADYPADVSKLQKLLLALADAKIVEEKTSNPANFPIIGVEEPTAAGATGAGLTLTAKDGKHQIIVGKPVGEGDFARRGGENSSYVVEPAIPLDTEARSWIEARLIDIPAAQVQSVELKLPPVPAPASAAATPKAAASAPSAASYAVRRLKPAEDNFSIDGVPAGRKALDARALAPSPTMLSTLDVDDVAPVGSIDFSKPALATITLADGNVITFTGTVAADKHWVQLSESKDAAFNTKTQGRAFEIPSYRYDAIFRPLDQVLAPKELPPAPKSGAAGEKPAAGSKTRSSPKAASPPAP
jgi:hypothetical protein